jgi:hypothetical protein
VLERRLRVSAELHANNGKGSEHRRAESSLRQRCLSFTRRTVLDQMSNKTMDKRLGASIHKVFNDVISL